MDNIIISIEEGSIASELGIKKGDILVSINGKEVKDIFDYRYLISDEYIEVEVEDETSELTIYEIEKDENEDLGIIFESGLMDNAKGCTNKCIFCFIDQLPMGMRKTLYFKDDDSRLSFLSGNYVTLTNMSEEDMDRIIYYHLSPINISVHTTNLELRKKMLKNEKSYNLVPYLKKLSNAGIEMNFQVVLCKGVNDGENLAKTISDLSSYIPLGKSLSIVPVGLSKNRDGLYHLEQFSPEDSAEVISIVENFQKIYKKKHETNFVYVADEFYLTAGREIPQYESYENFPQIENGVGMLSEFEWEFRNYISEIKSVNKTANIKRSVTVVTGKAAKDFISVLANELTEMFTGLEIYVVAVENDFFGELITVSGLLTGQDILARLKFEQERGCIGDEVLIPQNALRSGERVFLDDLTIDDLESELKVPVRAVATTGYDFIDSILLCNREEV